MIQRQEKIQSVAIITVQILYGFSHRKTVNPELHLSVHYMDKERKKKRQIIFAKPANSMLLQYSASGHAASAAPSALERLQRERSSWECNKSRIQYNRDCSVLWLHLKSHLPRSYFLFSDTYFVKLLFLMCPPLFSCLNYLFPCKYWLHMPFQCVTFSLNSQGTASILGNRHSEMPLTMEVLGTRNKTQDQIFARAVKPSKILVTSIIGDRGKMLFHIFSSKIPIDFNTAGYVPVHWNKSSVYECRQEEVASSKAIFYLLVLRSNS